jgi:hypothetical protein
VKLRGVVPPRRGLAAVLRTRVRQPASDQCPIAGAIPIVLKRGSKADLDAGADRKLDGLYAGHLGRAVALGTQANPSIAGCDDERAAGGKDCAGNHAQTITERAPGGQRSHMNPDRVDDSDTPAKKIGRALHALVLEGEAGFARAFAEEPQPSGHPGSLVTLEDLKAKCRELGEPVSGSKAELAKRIKAKAPDVIIFDDILGLFRAMVDRDGFEVLKPDAMAEVRAAAANIKLNPHLARAFIGGTPELSIFWIDEDGLPCKARYDYFKPRTIVNLKKFANQRERPVDLAIHLAISEYRYDLQAKHYLDSYSYFFAAAREGRVFGECPLLRGWERQIADPEAIVYSWVFHQMDGPPVTVGRQITARSPALNRASREIAHANALYRDCLDKYGSGRWVADEPIVDLLDTDLPPWMREDVEVL